MLFVPTLFQLFRGLTQLHFTHLSDVNPIRIRKDNDKRGRIMTTTQLTRYKITIERNGQKICLVWDEHMQEWAPYIPKH